MAELKINGLRGWLSEVEKIGEVKHITEEVDTYLEMGAINYLNGITPGHPTLLFEKFKGFPNTSVSVLFNPIGNSLNRLSLALRLQPGKSPLEIAAYMKDAFSKKIPPIAIDPINAPIFENIIEGDDINLFDFPAPTHWPRDGGPFIGTGDAVVTQDPENGRFNVGTYRQMVSDKNVVTYTCNPGSDTAQDRRKWWAQGKPCPVVAAYGVDPLLFAYASQRFPANQSEFDYVGGIIGEPVQVVPGKYTGLPIPATAEFVIEGFSFPDKTVSEGPFGEYSGYYGRQMDSGAPCIVVKAVYYRNKPILTAAMMADKPGANDQSLFWGLMRGAKIWNDLEVNGIPGVTGVWCPPAAAMGAHMTIVSLKQMHPGHAQQVAAVAAQCSAGACWCKYIIVVDDDINITDMEEVVWAVSTRCDPVGNIDFLRNAWSSQLDPSMPPEDRPFGSKALIIATKDYRRIQNYSKRTGMTKETYDQIKAKWQRLGFETPIPIPSFFDAVDETKEKIYK